MVISMVTVCGCLIVRSSEGNGGDAKQCIELFHRRNSVVKTRRIQAQVGGTVSRGSERQKWHTNMDFNSLGVRPNS